MKKTVMGKNKNRIISNKTSDKKNKTKKTTAKKLIVKKMAVKNPVLKIKKPAVKAAKKLFKQSASIADNKNNKKIFVKKIIMGKKPLLKSEIKPKLAIKKAIKPIIIKPIIKSKSKPKIIKPVLIKPVVLESEKQHPIMNNNGELMVGTLHEPRQKTDTIVILLHGFLSSKEHNLLKASAIALSRSGYCAYRVDFSGNGDSEGRFEDSTPNKQIQDAGIIVKHFKEKYSKVYLMGHSLGGAVCVAVAAVGGVDAIITIAPPMQKERIDSVLSAQQQDQITSVGFTILKVKKNLVEVPYTITSLFMDEIHELNPLNLATYVKCPALLMHGTADAVIPIIDTQDLYAVLGSKEKELLMIGGADHNFSNPEHLDALISALIAWMKKRK